MDEEDQSEILILQMELENIDDRIESIGQQINDFLTKQERLSEEKKKILKKINELEKHGVQPAEKLADWNSDLFSWSVELKEMMIQHFHISTFRPLQKETMNVTLSKQDCILIMPTGGGKSLSFQLPAMMSHGFTLVISPLVSLMEDQLIALRKLNINAMMLSASTSITHNSEVLGKMIAASTDMKLLYVTPERLAKSKRFMAKLEKAYSVGNISRIVIDEVHCASNWGHDFRPDYKILGILKRQFPKVPLLGLTATASEKVLADVKDILNLDRCIVFRASFNRPNLFYEVYKTSLDQKTLLVEIAKRIKLQFKEMSGIVYCFSRKDCEEVASGLIKHGITAHSYHSDLSAEVKTYVHEAWINGNIQVVVATIAFGMGIDKPNVRFVIHFSISKSMENYYQESGRAGRDDLQSWCILYFRFQDIFRQCAMVFTEKTGLQNLHHMLRYSVDRQKCRRTLIGKHFAEQWQASECKQMCDNCQRDPDAMKERSLAEEAMALIAILQEATYREERLTPIKLIDVWLGKCKVKFRPKDICYLPRDECEDVVTKLLIEQILREDFHFTPYNTITYVIPGSRWPLLKHGKICVKIDVLRKRKLHGSCKLDANQVDQRKSVSSVPKKNITNSSESNKNNSKSLESNKTYSKSPKCTKNDLNNTHEFMKNNFNSAVSVENNSDSSDCAKNTSNTSKSTENSSESSVSKKNNSNLSASRKNKLKPCEEDTKDKSNVTTCNEISSSKGKKTKVVCINTDSDSDTDSDSKSSVSIKNNPKLSASGKNKLKPCEEDTKDKSNITVCNESSSSKGKKRKHVFIDSDSDVET